MLLGFPKTSTESEHSEGAANFGKTSEVTHIHKQRKDLGHEDEPGTLSFLNGLSSAVSPRSPMRTRGMKRDEENVFHARGQSQGKPIEHSSPPKNKNKQCQHTTTAPLTYQADAFAVQPLSQPTPGTPKKQEVWWGLKKCLERGVTGNPPLPRLSHTHSRRTTRNVLLTARRDRHHHTTETVDKAVVPKQTRLTKRRG